MTIILEQLSRGFILNKPMCIGIFQNLLTPANQHDLATSYPNQGFQKTERLTPPGKLYSFSMAPLISDGVHQNHPILANKSWSTLIASLLEPVYKKTLADTLKIDLDNAKINIGLYKFSKGDFVSTHLDHKDKIATQLFYFNTSWDVFNGGFLELLNSQNDDSCFLRLPPISMYSIVIVRSDTAWHAVTPIQKQSQQPRLSLQLEYYRR